MVALGKLFYEKSVNSFPKLREELALLDLDSGIRTFGNYKGKKKQLVFVTRSPQDSYTLMVYENKAKSGNPVLGKRLLVREFRKKENLGKYMRNLLTKPVRAFVY